MRPKRTAGIPSTPCWPWTRAIDGAGYGTVWSQGRLVGAHRYVYEALIGPIPDGLQLDHRCRTPTCVNPDHLEPVLQATNIRRGTGVVLSLDAAADIRDEHARGVAIGLLALKYGVGVRTIKAVIANKSWRAAV